MYYNDGTCINRQVAVDQKIYFVETMRVLLHSPVSNVQGVSSMNTLAAVADVAYFFVMKLWACESLAGASMQLLL